MESSLKMSANICKYMQICMKKRWARRCPALRLVANPTWAHACFELESANTTLIQKTNSLENVQACGAISLLSRQSELVRKRCTATHVGVGFEHSDHSVSYGESTGDVQRREENGEQGAHYLGDLYTESGQTSECSFSSVATPAIARVGSFFSHFSRSTRFSLLRTAPNRKFQQKTC